MLKKIASVLSGTLFAQALGVVKGILMPALLSPFQLGVWNVYVTLIGYGANAHLGLQHGVSQLIPLLPSDLQSEKSKEIISTAHFGILVLSVFVSCGILLYLFSENYKFIDSILIGIYIVLQSITQFHALVARSISRFNIYSLSISLGAFLTSSMTLAALYFFKSSITHALIGLCFAQSILLLYLLYCKQYSLMGKFKHIWFFRLFKYGRALIVLGLLDMVILTIDRWFVLSNFGMEALGAYAFAMFFIALIGAVPAAASQVMYPMLVKTNARKLSRDQLWIEYAIPLISMLANLIAVTVYFLSPYFIENFYPKYLDAIQIIKVLVLGGVFFALQFIPGTSAVAGRRVFSLIKIQTFSLITAFVAIQLLIWFELGVAAVAIGYVLLFFLYGLGYLYSEIKFMNNREYAIIYCIKTIAPIIFVYVIIFFLGAESSHHLLLSLVNTFGVWLTVVSIYFWLNSKNPLFLEIKKKFTTIICK